MILNEIFGRQAVMEWGKHGFPGFGMSLFSQQHFEYVASQIANVPDEVLRLDLGQWFERAFDRDRSNFNSGRFMDWIRNNKRGGRGHATFQQRHFYYFAHLIKNEDDDHRREFLTDWLGEMFRRCNDNFKASLWDKFCQPEKQIEPLNEGPAFGSPGFPGFARQLFTRSHRGTIGAHVSRLADTVIRHEIGAWFAEAFSRDLPNSPGMPKRFDAEGYVAEIDKGGRFSEGNPRFQMRHYYYLAKLISDEPDIQKRIFLCHFLTPIFRQNNEHFQPSRWEDFCNIPAEHRDWKPENRKKGVQDYERSERIDEPSQF